MVAWADSAVRVQRITRAGEIAAGWSLDGVDVSPAYTPFNVDVGLAADGSGGAFITWIHRLADCGPGCAEAYAQHVNAQGSIAPGWPSGGLLLRRGVQWRPDIVPDSSGGMIAFWSEQIYRCSEQVCDWVETPAVWGERYRLDGTPSLAWYKRLAAQPVDQGLVRTLWDPATRTALVLISEPPFEARSLRALRIDVDGNPAAGWLADGIVVIPAGPVHVNRWMASDGSAGVLVATMELHADTGWDISIQHVLADGTQPIGWPANGVPVCTAPLDQYFPDITTDGTGGAYVVWQDVRSGVGNAYAQHISTDGKGDTDWPVDGFPLAPSAAKQDGETVMSDGLGGAFFAWVDRREGGSQIFAQRRLPDRSVPPGWKQEGTAITTSPGDKGAPLIAPLAPNEAAVVWTDSRDGSPQLYAQHLAGDGVVPVFVSLADIEVVPGHVSLRWFSAQANGIAATVQRRLVSGGWVTVGEIISGGDGYLRFDDGSVEPGRYGYRLQFQIPGAAASTLSEETWVDVSGGFAFGLEAPNPCHSGAVLSMTVTLPGGQRSRIEIFDLLGRCRAVRELAASAAGRHEFTMTDVSLAPGLYVVRLTQGRQSALKKLAVLN